MVALLPYFTRTHDIGSAFAIIMYLDWILGAGNVQSLIVRDPLCEQGIQKAHTNLDMIYFYSIKREQFLVSKIF